ncbi:MAG: peptide chain release factor 1 [Bacillales bacterium]|nr:peptide chain release factor 1 [Bacillales bacterium]
MTDRLKQIEKRAKELQTLLSDPEVQKNIKKMTVLSKELSSYDKLLSLYAKYKELNDSLPELKKLSEDKDQEISEMATLEMDEAEKALPEIEEQMKILLIPKDPSDDKNVVMQIRGAAGGDEANIFAGDLFRMYSKYCEAQGFKVEVSDAETCEAGGFSQIEFIVNGYGAYSKLKYESGSHRVQRIPVTESSGRIHTSTATVLVIPEAEEVEFELNMDEVRVDIFHSSGAGGQGVNTTFSAIRVAHIPTGTVVLCQDERSQHENKAQALKILKARLYDKMMREKEEKEGAERLSKIGTGDRSEKIRTYNYPQNRVTDHRIGFTIQQLDRVMEGKLDPIIDALIQEEIKRKLESRED